MKKTFYLMLLAAAITGSQAFADYIPTTIEGADFTEPNFYDGEFAETGDATGANVSVYANTKHGSDEHEAWVYGGTVMQSGYSSFGNIIVMQGGEVTKLIAGSSTGYNDSDKYNVYNNIVIMNGGKVFDIVGGENNGKGEGSVNNNQVVIAGGFVGGDDANGNIWGGHNGATSPSVEVKNNTVSLVGTDASVTINDVTYDGDVTTINADILVGSSEGEGNTLSIAGSDITVNGTIKGMQNLNFSLVDGLTSSMLTYNGGANLVLSNIEYSFSGDAVTNWVQYEGKNLTLIDSPGMQIIGFVAPADAIKITDASGNVLATANLEQTDNFTLKLTNIHSENVPEPATGTLSLLALAGLCARRRRK